MQQNVNIKHRAGKENVIADALSHNPQECLEEVEEVKVCISCTSVLRMREQLIQHQKRT